MKLIRTFLKGGVFAPDNTRSARDVATWNAMIPARSVVPLLQHEGAPARCVVERGDRVDEGALIGSAQGYQSARVHAPIPGVVSELTRLTLPDGRESEAVVIELDGEFQQLGRVVEPRDWRGLNNDRIQEQIFDAGVVGLGGTGVPSHVKYSAPRSTALQCLILNGCEPEPYLSNDYRLLRERPEHVVEALEILVRLLAPKRTVIALGGHTRSAASGVRRAVSAARARIQVHRFAGKYPQGDDHVLVRSVTKRAVRGASPVSEAGSMVVNVATAIAVYEAVVFGKPVVERVVTVAGGAITRPGNLKVRIGASIGDLIEECEGFREPPHKLVVGGPMRGSTVTDLSQPVTKLTTGVLALTEAEVQAVPETACIRCGRCVRACPMGLEPVRLHQLIAQRRDRAVTEAGLFDCTECGCCSFICPAGITLAEDLKRAKSRLRAEESDGRGRS